MDLGAPSCFISTEYRCCLVQPASPYQPQTPEPSGFASPKCTDPCHASCYWTCPNLCAILSNLTGPSASARWSALPGCLASYNTCVTGSLWPRASPWPNFTQSIVLLSFQSYLQFISSCFCILSARLLQKNRSPRSFLSQQVPRKIPQ
jgi:hypothetical protein